MKIMYFPTRKHLFNMVLTKIHILFVFFSASMKIDVKEK